METTNTRRSPIGAAAAIALVVALPFTVAACSSGSDTDTAGSSSSSGTGIGAKWGACIRDAGFDVEDPDDDLITSGNVVVPEGADERAFGNAAAKCAADLGIKAADSAKQEKFARQYEQVGQCIRDNGYEDFDGVDGRGGITTEGYPRAEEPEFDKTFQECLAEYSPDTRNTQR